MKLLINCFYLWSGYTLNILLVSSNPPFEELGPRVYGGAERSLRIIGEQLSKKGHNIYYLTTSKLIMGKKTIDGISVFGIFYPYIPYFHNYFKIVKNFNLYIENFFNQRIIKKIIKKNEIQIVHLYSPFSLGYDVIDIANKMNIPVILRIAGKPWNVVKGKKIKEELFIETLKKIKYFLPNCLYLKDEFIKYYNKNIGHIESIEVMDIGVYIEDLNNISSDNYLVNASNFKKYQKRQDILVESISVLKKNGYEKKLLLIGMGNNQEKIRKKIENMNLKNNVLLLGRLSHKKSIEMVRYCEIFVHASEYEGVSKTILEAMMLSKPIIASKAPGINEYIINGKTGILVENSPEKFAEKIIYLSENKNLGHTLGKNARNYVNKKYNPRNNVVHYERLFKDIILKNK